MLYFKALIYLMRFLNKNSKIGLKLFDKGLSASKIVFRYYFAGKNIKTDTKARFKILHYIFQIMDFFLNVNRINII